MPLNRGIDANIFPQRYPHDLKMKYLEAIKEMYSTPVWKWSWRLQKHEGSKFRHAYSIAGTRRS